MTDSMPRDALHKTKESERHCEEAKPLIRRFVATIDPVGKKCGFLYLAGEAVHDESLDVVVHGEPASLGVRVGLDARDEVGGPGLGDGPAVGVEPPGDPRGRVGQEPVGHHRDARANQCGEEVP